MSTKQITCWEAICKQCGNEASKVREAYFNTEKEAKDSRVCVLTCCTYTVIDSRPAVEKRYAYQAVCDGCGYLEDDFDHVTAIGPTPDEMWENLPDWTHHDDQDYCLDCTIGDTDD